MAQSKSTLQHPGYPAENLVALLRKRATETPDAEVYTFLKDGLKGKRTRVTFADLDRRARAIGALLQAQGAEGERVVLLFPPGYDYIAGFFGCMYAGAIAVPAYPPDPTRLEHSLSKLKPILKDSGAKFALSTAQITMYGALKFRAVPELRSLRWLPINAPIGMLSLRWKEPKLTRDSLAFLQYTSGSTGDPKGVMVSHGNLLHNLGWIQARLGLSASDRAVIWLPPYHDLGLIGGLLAPVHTGYPCTLMSPFDFMKDPFSWVQAISEFRATATGGPGFAYDLCARKVSEEQKRSLDLSCLKTAFIGAEPIHPDTMDRFAKTFGACGFRKESFFPTFGLAEGTLLVTGGPHGREPEMAIVDGALLESHKVENRPKGAEGARTLVGCGETQPDIRMIVVDPETRRIAGPASVGEIWISSPSVAKGYWNRPELTQEVFLARLADGEGPYLRTGDLGFVRGGELFLTGRLKDLIIINGKNYYPQDIEWAAQGSHPDLRPGGCVAFPVAREGSERLVIVAEVRKGAGVDPVRARQIQEAVRGAVMAALNLRASEVTLIQAGILPKTSSGKLQRRKTREMWLQGKLGLAVEGAKAGANGAHANGAHAADASALAGMKPGEARVLALISKESALPVAEIKPAQRLVDDLGFDSLMMAHLYLDLQGEFPGAALREFQRETTVAQILEDLGGATPVATSTVVGENAKTLSLDQIPDEAWKVELFPEVKRLEARFKLFEQAGTGNPYFKAHESPSRDTTKMNGRDMIHFSGYNYVGMSGDPRVSAAAKKAVDQYGTSASASRLASGEIPLHKELEREIADFLGTDDAIVMVAGHATNTTTIGHMVGQGDLILHDSLAHDSIIQGSLLSGAQRRPFPHNDWQELDRILTRIRGRYRRVLIPIEGAYSMDGDVPDLPKFIEVKNKHKALLFVDEAHSIGVLGKTGRGVTEHFGVNPRDVDLLMGTLSKSLASCGGYIAGSHALVQFLKYTCPGFVYSVGLPPSNAAASLEAIRVLKDEPQRIAHLREISSLFLKLARERGLDTGPSEGTPIVPVIVGSSLKCLKLSEALAARGVNVQPILYPAVAEDATRLRFFINSTHTEEQVRYTVNACAEELERLNRELPAGLVGANVAVDAQPVL